MGALTGVVIYDSVLFERGHMIMRWAEAVERRYTANAILEAPVNKRVNKSHQDIGYPVGSLKASIRGEVYKVGPKHIQTVISVNVPYAIFVIRGTSDIVPVNGPFLRLPFNAGFVPLHKLVTGFGRPTLHKVVRGQGPDDFLGRAHDLTAARHPSLRGFGTQVFQQF